MVRIVKKKNGFTLVELLAVIVILAILVTIAVPSTMSISNRIKKNMYCSKIDFIENAAKLYGEDRRKQIENKGGSMTVTVKELVNTNYLKKDHDTEPFIEDPRTKESLDNLKLTVNIKNNRIAVTFDNTINQTCEK